MSADVPVALCLVTWCCLATAYQGMNVRSPLTNLPLTLSRQAVVPPWGLDMPLTVLDCDDSVGGKGCGRRMNLNIIGDSMDREDEDEDDLSGMEWNSYTDKIVNALNGWEALAFNNVNDVYVNHVLAQEVLSDLPYGRTDPAGSWTEGGVNGITSDLGSSSNIRVGSVSATGIQRPSVHGVGGASITGNSGGASTKDDSSFNNPRISDHSRISSLAEAFQLFVMAYQKRQGGSSIQTFTIPDSTLLKEMVRDFYAAQQSSLSTTTPATAHGTGMGEIRGTDSHNSDASVLHLQNNVVPGTSLPFQDILLPGTAETGRLHDYTAGSVDDFKHRVNLLADKLASDAGINPVYDNNGEFSTFGVGGTSGLRSSTNALTSHSDSISSTGMSFSTSLDGQINGGSDMIRPSVNTVGWVPSGGRLHSHSSADPQRFRSNTDFQQSGLGIDSGFTTNSLLDNELFARVMAAGHDATPSGEQGGNSASPDSHLSRRLTNTVRSIINDMRASNTAVKLPIGDDLNTVGSNRNVLAKPLFLRPTSVPLGNIGAISGGPGIDARTQVARTSVSSVSGVSGVGIAGQGQSNGGGALNVVSSSMSKLPDEGQSDAEISLNTVVGSSGTTHLDQGQPVAGGTLNTAVSSSSTTLQDQDHGTGVGTSSTKLLDRVQSNEGGTLTSSVARFNTAHQDKGQFDSGGTLNAPAANTRDTQGQSTANDFLNTVVGSSRTALLDQGQSNAAGTRNTVVGSSRTTLLDQGQPNAAGTRNTVVGSSRTTLLDHGQPNAAGTRNTVVGSSRTALLDHGQPNAAGTRNTVVGSSRTTLLDHGQSNAAGTRNTVVGSSRTTLLDHGQSNAAGTRNTVVGSSRTALLDYGQSSAAGTRNTVVGSSRTTLLDHGQSNAAGTRNTVVGSSRTTLLDHGQSSAAGTRNTVVGSSRTTLLHQGQSNAAGTRNTVVGSSRTALLDQGQSNAAGTRNTVVGSSRTTLLDHGQSNAAGTRNTVVGSSRTALLDYGQSSAAGTRNTVVGSSRTTLLDHGQSNAAGTRNTVVGSSRTTLLDHGQSNTAGTRNTVVGSSRTTLLHQGQPNAAGTRNTVVGSSRTTLLDHGQSNAAGTRNTVVGSSRTALLDHGQSNAAGTRNTVVGSSRTTLLDHGQSNAAGTRNTVVGSSRTALLDHGQSNAAGTRNTVVGSSRTTLLDHGQSNAAGTRNTVVGSTRTTHLDQSGSRGFFNTAVDKSTITVQGQGQPDSRGNLNTANGSTRTAPADQGYTGNSLHIDPIHKQYSVRTDQGTPVTAHGRPAAIDSGKEERAVMSSDGYSNKNPGPKSAPFPDTARTSVGTSRLSSIPIKTGSPAIRTIQGMVVKSQTEQVPQNINMFSSDSARALPVINVELFSDTHGNLFRLFRIPSSMSGSALITSADRQDTNGHSNRVNSISAASSSATSNQGTMAQMSTAAELVPGTNQVDSPTSLNHVAQNKGPQTPQDTDISVPFKHQ